MATVADQTTGPARFSIQIDHDNGAHVHFRLFAATGAAHLGLAGRLTMRAEEFAAFTALLRDDDTTGAVTVITNTIPPEQVAQDEPQIIEHDGVQLRVIPMDQHDRRCEVRVASPQGTTPEVLHCHFCGFCYPKPAAAPATSQPGSEQ